MPMKNATKRITLILGLFLATLGMAAEENSLAIYAGYNGSKKFEKYNGANIGAGYTMPILSFLSFDPEAMLEWRQNYEKYIDYALDKQSRSGNDWQTDLSLRALVNLHIPTARLVSFFTGPRMDIMLFHGNDNDYHKEPMPGLPAGAKQECPYNVVNAYWQFGAKIEVSSIILRGSYSLPFTNYVKDYLNHGTRLHLFEAAIGYRF